MIQFMIDCPTTGHRVSTGIRIAGGTWNSGPEFHAYTPCFACGGLHHWSAKEVTLCDESEAARFAAVSLEGAMDSEIVGHRAH
jgi:hypothetical protein